MIAPTTILKISELSIVIYPDTKIKILGKDNDSKGKEFENLMIKVVAILGYPIIRERVRSTGMEIDFFAMNI